MTRLVLATLLMGISATLAVAQTSLPVVSDPAVADGEAHPFEGNWSIMKPGGDRSSETDSCAMPASIRAASPTSITYASSTGAEFTFAVADENDATAWRGELDRIAVWQGTDAFLLYSRLADGTPDPAAVYLYERCPIWPRTSYEGAVPGALEPFVGAWQEAVPPARGAEPLQIFGACNDPTRFAISGSTTLNRTIAGQADYTLEVLARGNDTIVPNPRAGYAPSVIVWVSPDRFHFHIIDVFGGTNWFSPVIYTRCPS